MKNASILVFSTLLLSLVGCGGRSGDGASAQQREESPIRVATVDWKISLQGRSFPDHSRVDVDGVTVLDECVGKQKYQIDRRSAPQSLTLTSYPAPAKSTVKIVITDLGDDCSSYSTFFSDDAVEFESPKEHQILINI